MADAAQDGPEGDAVRRLIGVYHADGTVRGELAYVVGRSLGRAHCSLCDVTHGRVRERADWRACRDELPVPFETFHRDDQPDRVRAAAGVTPVVVAETDADEIVVLLGPDELEACGGSPEHLVGAVRAALAERALRFAAA